MTTRSWHELSMNPEAVTQIYRVPPSLSRVQLTEVELHRDGPRIRVHAVLSGGRGYSYGTRCRWV